MNRKNTFTYAEIQQIEKLIEQKQTADRSQQKGIRNKIRDIGFHWEDFHPKDESPKVKFDILNFRNLIAEGSIKVTDAPFQKKEVHTPSVAKPQGGKNIFHRIVNLFSPHKDKNQKEGLEPWVGTHPKVLIVGSMPGDESIRQQTYYANISRNSFWKIMYTLFPKEDGVTNKEYVTALGIALWDCVHSAVREKSADAGFDNATVVPNDMRAFMAAHPSITTIIINGKGAPTQYFEKYFPDVEVDHLFILNSTSNACAMPFEKKLNEWSILKKIVKQRQ